MLPHDISLTTRRVINAKLFSFCIFSHAMPPWLAWPQCKCRKHTYICWGAGNVKMIALSTCLWHTSWVNIYDTLIYYCKPDAWHWRSRRRLFNAATTVLLTIITLIIGRAIYFRYLIIYFTTYIRLIFLIRYPRCWWPAIDTLRGLLAQQIPQNISTICLPRAPPAGLSSFRYYYWYYILYFWDW